MSNRTRRHLGPRSEVETARANGTTTKVLCGRVFVPDGEDHGQPTCKQCERIASKRPTRVASFTYKILGPVQTWNY